MSKDSNFSLTKENILAKKGSYNILNDFLQSFHNKGRLRQGQHISNPFLSEKQKTPSFHIFCSFPNHEWQFNDPATDDKGSVFDLVMRLNNCTFKESLKIINDKYKLGLGLSTASENGTPIQTPTNPKTSEPEPPKRVFNIVEGGELTYWFNYASKEQIVTTLKRYDVKPLTSYTTTNKEGKPYTIKSTSENPIFAFKISNDCYKIYQPNKAEYKHLWLGKKPDDYKNIFQCSLGSVWGKLVFFLHHQDRSQVIKKLY